jgi:flagellar biosynthesis/type III secretory pathway chaperone
MADTAEPVETTDELQNNQNENVAEPAEQKATAESEVAEVTEAEVEESSAVAGTELEAKARHGVPEVANKSDYVEPGTWQAEQKEKGVSRTRGGDPHVEAESTKPKATPHNMIPSAEEISVAEKLAQANYNETDVFAWANNIVQYKDELKIDLFLFNKNYVVYRTARATELDKQMEPLFLDSVLEYVLEGVEQGLVVRGFEQAEAESNVLQRTQVYKVDKLREVLGWLKTQEHEIELFVEEEHDMKRIKGVIARLSHKEMDKPVYIIKALPQSQVMQGRTGWMLRNNKMVPFDADAALRIPNDNQLLVLDQDLYVFNQSKLKTLFGYDAKESYIAEQKVREIEENFRLSFAEGSNIQEMVKGKRPLIKKLQKLDTTKFKQDEIISRSDEMEVGLMEDDGGKIIIMDDKDLTRFVNLLNDDYYESPLSGTRYEITGKKEMKPVDEEELLKQVLPE